MVEDWLAGDAFLFLGLEVEEAGCLADPFVAGDAEFAFGKKVKHGVGLLNLGEEIES